MTAMNNGKPTYDVAGMNIVGHGTPWEKLTLDGSQTSDPSTGTLTAGVMYRLWGSFDFYYILAETPVATDASIPVTAKMPEFITPKEDIDIAVVDAGDAGSVWITRMERYGE